MKSFVYHSSSHSSFAVHYVFVFGMQGRKGFLKGLANIRHYRK